MNDNIALDKQFQPCYYKPIDIRIEVDNESDIMNIKQPYVGMNVYCSSNEKTYQITGISINDKLSTVTSYAENTNPSDKAKLDKIPAYADKFVSFEYAYEGSNLDFKLKYIYNSYNEILGSFANTTRSLIIPISDGNVPSGLMSKSDKDRLDSLPDKPSVITDFVTELNNIEQSATLHLKYTDVDGEHDLEAYIDAATTTWPGLMSTTDKNKLNEIPAGAIDLTSVQNFRDASSYTFRLNYTDKDGSHYEDLTIPSATVDYAGLLTPADRAVIYGNTGRITTLEERVAALKSFDIVSVDVLPTASASTMNKLYLVPAEDSETTNIKDEYITIQSTSGYAWEAIGKTNIDLSNYVQKRTGYDLSQNDFTNAYKSIIDNLSTNYQEKLVSGTNIKTINNQSLLGSGNITISGGGTYSPGDGISINSNNVISASIDSETMEFKSGTIKSKTGFKSVIVGSSTIAANGISSINLVAGSNITLSTDVLTNTITISSSGGGGGSYTPGTGINISNNTISVDTSVIATKSDISSKISNGFAQINVNDIATLYASGESIFKLAAGSNIQFAVNTSTNTITISSSGGGGGSVGVVDGLTSTSATDALSANQGRVLKGLINDSEYAFIKSFTLNNVEASWIPGTARKLQIQTVFSGSTQGIHAELANNGVLQLGLEKATDSTPGGVIVDGTTITANNGVISANLPTIVDNLTSSSTTSALSANQGKILKGLIDGISGGGVVKFAKVLNSLPSEIIPSYYIMWNGIKIKQQITELNGTIYLNAKPPSPLAIETPVDRMMLATAASSPQYWYLIAWNSNNPSARYVCVVFADNVWAAEGTHPEPLNPSFEGDIQDGDVLFLSNEQSGYTANKFYTANIIPQLTSITYDNETTPNPDVLYICTFDNIIYYYNGNTLIPLSTLSEVYINLLNNLISGYVSKLTVGSTSLKNDVKLVAGSNITLTPNTSNNTITIASSGGGSGGVSKAFSAIKVVKGAQSSTMWAVGEQILELVQGDNIVFTADTISRKITISATGGSGGGLSDAFAKVKVGSTEIESESSDTLEFIAGSNISLTPNATNKTITISATGGGSSLEVPVVTLPNTVGENSYTSGEFEGIGFTSVVVTKLLDNSVYKLQDTTTNTTYAINKVDDSKIDLVGCVNVADEQCKLLHWCIDTNNYTILYQEYFISRGGTITFHGNLPDRYSTYNASQWAAMGFDNAFIYGVYNNLITKIQVGDDGCIIFGHGFTSPSDTHGVVYFVRHPDPSIGSNPTKSSSFIVYQVDFAERSIIPRKYTSNDVIGFAKPSSDISDVTLSNFATALHITETDAEAIFDNNRIKVNDGNDDWTLPCIGMREKTQGTGIVKIEKYFGMQMYSSYQYQFRFVKELVNDSWVYSVKFKSV